MRILIYSMHNQHSQIWFTAFHSSICMQSELGSMCNLSARAITGKLLDDQGVWWGIVWWHVIAKHERLPANSDFPLCADNDTRDTSYLYNTFKDYTVLTKFLWTKSLCDLQSVKFSHQLSDEDSKIGAKCSWEMRCGTRPLQECISTTCFCFSKDSCTWGTFWSRSSSGLLFRDDALGGVMLPMA